MYRSTHQEPSPCTWHQYRCNASRSTVWIPTQAKPQNDASLQVAVCAIQGSHSHHHLDCYCWCHIQYSLSHSNGNDLCQYTARSQHINFWFSNICHTGYHHDVLPFKWIHCRCLLWTTEDSRHKLGPSILQCDCIMHYWVDHHLVSTPSQPAKARRFVFAR